MNNSSTSSFKKSLLQLFLFTIAFVGCYYAMFFLLSSISYQNENLLGAIQPKFYFYRDATERTFVDFKKEDEAYDYIFIGGSHCYRNIDPANFIEHGLKTYNLGSPAQTPLNSYYILKEHIAKAKK